MFARIARFGAVGAGGYAVYNLNEKKQRRHQHGGRRWQRGRAIARPGILAAIGNTPLIELTGLSELTGVRIFGKCEFQNPGGSVKDRAALFIVEQAEREGKLQPGGTIFEGTGGNTGVALAMIAAAKGYSCVCAMPAAIVASKQDAIRAFGATAILTPAVHFRDPQHYYQVAKSGAANTVGGFFASQFNNAANARAHFEGTAPEFWRQTGQRVDGFVCSAGTGGTIAGCSQFLKGVNPAVSVWLIDPLGSGLFDYVNAGSEAKYTTEQVGDESVRFIQRSSGSTIAEGVGIGRVTDNLAEALIDRAVRGNNQEIVEMCYYLKEKEGVFVGPSAAMNVVGAVKLARTLPKGSTVVTILCDGGEKYTTKVYDPAWLKEQGLQAEAYKNTDDLSWIR